MFVLCYKTYVRNIEKVLAELMAAHAKPNALLRGAKGSPYVEAGDHERYVNRFLVYDSGMRLGYFGGCVRLRKALRNASAV